MKRDFEKMRLLAEQLAKLFGDGQLRGPCACSGLSCADAGCSLWWHSFLRLSADKLTRIVLAYEAARGEIIEEREPSSKIVSPILIRSLARLYFDDRRRIWSSHDPRSEVWWKMFLGKVESEDFRRAIGMCEAVGE